MMRQKIFIGCSSESLDIAYAIQTELTSRDRGYIPVIWKQNVIKNGDTTVPALIKDISNCRFAIFIFNKDDKTTSRKKTKSTTRDNVIFEYGLAAGILGKDACFIFKASSVDLPSDFNGMSVSIFESDIFTDNIQARIGHCITEFENSIKSRSVSNTITWQQYMANTSALCKKLNRSPRQNGFSFDAIVGVARGGIIAADLINRKFMARAPLFCLWSDYYTHQPQITFETELAKSNDEVLRALEDDRFKNILVVDDITRKALTITRAAEFIRKRHPDKNVKTAVLFVPKQLSKKVDYFAEAITDDQILMPYNIID